MNTQEKISLIISQIEADSDETKKVKEMKTTYARDIVYAVEKDKDIRSNDVLDDLLEEGSTAVDECTTENNSAVEEIGEDEFSKITGDDKEFMENLSAFNEGYRLVIPTVPCDEANSLYARVKRKIKAVSVELLKPILAKQTELNSRTVSALNQINIYRGDFEAEASRLSRKSNLHDDQIEALAISFQKNLAYLLGENKNLRNETDALNKRMVELESEIESLKKSSGESL